MTIVNLQSYVPRSKNLKRHDGAPFPLGLCMLVWLAISAALWSGIIAAF